MKDNMMKLCATYKRKAVNDDDEVGKRTYFFDVKATKGNDYYLTITESKRRVDNNGHFAYDKHKIFLYKEDFEKFTEGLEEVIRYIRTNCLKDGGAGEHFTDVNFEEL